jgi:hypothetical protein
MDTNAFQYASQWNFPNEIEEASLSISFKQSIGVAWLDISADATSFVK